MAYYMRSNSTSSHGNYMMSNSSMQGGYLMHSAKGSEWKKPHKYLDKRWIDGAWHYLYEIPKEFAQRAGEAAKDTAEKVSTAAKNAREKAVNTAMEKAQKAEKAAKETVEKAAAAAKTAREKAVDTVKDTTQKATKAAKDFKDYSDKIDIKEARAKETIDEGRAGYTSDGKVSRPEAIHQRIANIRKDRDKAEAEKTKAEKELAEMNDRWHNGEVVNQKEIHDAKARVNAADQAIKDAEKAIKNAEAALQREAYRAEDALRAEEEAKKEKESAKYKASKALNALDDMIDDASGSAKQGLQWLKNQLNSGADWTTNQIEKIRESDAVASLSGKLENLYANTNSKAAKTGLNIINQLIGWGNLGPVENVSRSSRSFSGRNYSGTGNKAQKREIVAGGPVSNNDYRRRPKR